MGHKFPNRLQTTYILIFNFTQKMMFHDATSGLSQNFYCHFFSGHANSQKVTIIDFSPFFFQFYFFSFYGNFSFQNFLLRACVPPHVPTKKPWFILKKINENVFITSLDQKSLCVKMVNKNAGCF